jgi:hypothetical protein
MITLTEILSLESPLISAASGLIAVGEKFYIVSDDELFLFSVNADLKQDPKPIRLFQGELPEDKAPKKKLKPDLEALVYLPKQNQILCLPSGSKKNRIRGALVSVNEQGEHLGEVHNIDLGEIYSELEKKFSELNIEGVILLNHQVIRLFQRGNGEKKENGIIDLDLMSFLEGKPVIKKITTVKLGDISGIPLSFTDASIQENRIWFLAAAEDTESTYLDGEFAGAVLGEMDIAGNILQKKKLKIADKPEGLCLCNDKTFYLVTDADNRSMPSKMYRGTLP